VLACACLVPLLALQQGSAFSGSAFSGSAFRAIGIAAAPAAPVPPPRVETVAPAPPAPQRVAPPSIAAKPAPVAASSPDVTAPRPIYKPEPQYSEDARIAKIQGSVKLSVVIDEQGRPDDIKVTTSLDPGLDQQAVEAVRQWLFAPATKDGVPVPVSAFIEVNFRLL
jgi:TonB family protein